MILVWFGICRRYSDDGIRTATIIFSINTAILDSSSVDYLVAPVAIWPPSDFNRLCFGYTHSIHSVYRLHMSLAFATVRHQRKNLFASTSQPYFGYGTTPSFWFLSADSHTTFGWIGCEILRVEVRILVKATQFEVCFAFNSYFTIRKFIPQTTCGVSLSSG